MEVFAIKSVVGSEGISPMILVYGTIPRPGRVFPAETQLERAEIFEEAKKEAQKEHAKRRPNCGLNHYTGPERSKVSVKLMSPRRSPSVDLSYDPEGLAGTVQLNIN